MEDIRTCLIETRAIHYLHIADEWIDINSITRELNIPSIRTNTVTRKH